jgi:FAD/FMN-containing dehydrogenase
MNYRNPSRRIVLRQLASASVIGALDLLRSRPLFAAEPAAPTAGPIPGLQGTVIRRQDQYYEAWRQSLVWHRSKPARYPDMIVQARTEGDAIAAVRYAAENKLKVAVRSGGHNPLGPSVRDGGMCLDLSALTDILVDTSRQVASIQTGVRSLQLIRTLGTHGLCFPTPHCVTVGMGGFLMGGGLGWNHPYRGGVATFNIDAAEVITADGNRVIATAERNSDLLWAVRGGGPGFFGAVTRFHLRLYPAPKAILASSYILPLERLETMTSVLDRITAKTDPRLEILALLMHNPEAPPDAPPERSKICFLTAFAFGDSVDDCRSMLAPIAQSAIAQQSVTKDENQQFTFDRLYPAYFGGDKPGGYMGRYACDSAITDEPGKILHALADHFRRTPSPISHVIASYGLNLKARDDACFSSIAKHYVGCFAIWDEDKDDARNFKWLDQSISLMDPFARGHYVNEVEVRLRPGRIRYCYSDAAWKRLQELRKKYDPNGVFHTYLGQT